MSTVLPPPVRHSRITRQKLARFSKTAFTKGFGFVIAGVVLLLLILGIYLKENWNNLKVMVSPLEAGTSDTIRIFDRNDKLVCTISGNEDRVPVALKQVSPNMQHAVLAAEDHAFYQHHGINPESILRAALVNVRSGRTVEGGSTITQQLAKEFYSRGARRTIVQKLKESFIACQLESNYSKEKLLEAYLNQVYFGRGAYGIERASELYFGKSAAKLNISESAFLAALINSPSRLSTAEHRQDALNRQRLILDAMKNCGFISSADLTSAKSSELHIRKPSSLDSYYQFYVDAVLATVRNMPGQIIESKHGLSIYTSMDPAAQREAIVALNKGIGRAPHGVSQGALVSISVNDGSVLALVGGAGDYWKHQYNRAIYPHTVGSAFKPFVYLSGIIQGVLGPHSVLEDEPITVLLPDTKPYSPRNFDHQFYGALTVRQALARSRNVCAVEVAVNTGLDKVIDVARLAGIKTPLNPDVSLALGCCAISPLEMASAYSTLARGGVVVEPRLVRRIEDFSGSNLFYNKPVATRVFEREPVAELVDVMQDVVNYGTGTSARLPGRPVAGKTGTADQAKDLWFVGFTPDVVTATWGGNDQNLPIPGTRVTGGSVMAGIWRDYMLAYYKSHPTLPVPFPPPLSPMDRDMDAPLAFSTDDTFKEVEPDNHGVQYFGRSIGHRHGGFFGHLLHALFN